MSQSNQLLLSLQFPKREERGFYKGGFASERRAYQTFRSSNCTAVPAFFGSTSSLIVSYPDNIPQHDRLFGKQNAIMIELLDAEMITFDNLSRSVATKTLHALEQIHKLSICHGDISDYGCDLFRNVMLLRNGEVKWIDFEHSWVDAGEEIRLEMAVALEMWGPKGCVWSNRCAELRHY
jgi:serine/threonine protein kinase